ncbi:MAG TPA: DNA-3-methyladenine glycosylase 2 family protein [Acidimicrobiia bacterium]|nr:DNA-3-methyladenine glycosylase 2 family protein [Acidimicrobiia bacterium]
MIVDLEPDVAALVQTDPVLATARAVTGPIHLRLRDPGLGTLLHLILEQQISIDAARAMYARLLATAGGVVTPEAILQMDDETMRSCGFTRQKTGYARGLARAVADGELDLVGLAEASPAEATAILTTRRGIGPWTAANYRLWALGDRDVFPTGDLALAIGWQELAELTERPTYRELDERAERWRPHRTAAALLIWNHYLAVRGRA